MSIKTKYGYRIIDLAKEIPFKDVAKALRYHYAIPKIEKKTMSRYEEIMEEMSKYKINPEENLDEQLEIILHTAYAYFNKKDKKWITLTEFGEEYYSAGMKKRGENCGYAIDFTRWEIASNWVISKKTMDSYTPSEILAHFLWEMTFSGYTQAPIQKRMKGLQKMVKDIESGKAKTIPYKKGDFKVKKK